MSNEKPKNNRFAFTSLDGEDENGHRAEVRVKVNTGKIKAIKPSDNGKVVHIEFSVEKAKYPIAGWAPLDSDVHKEAQRALAADEEIEYRIETQRRPEKGADRITPLDELDSASQVKSLVVAINGKTSGEGVTNPAEDNHFNGGTGRYVANGTERASENATNSSAGAAVSADQALGTIRNAARSGQVRASIIDALAAQALLAGATPEQVNEAIAGDANEDNSRPRDEYPAGYAMEGKPWQDYNSDGRVNLGSARISAGVGVENLVFKHIAEVDGVEAPNREEVSHYLSSLIFAICDTIQAGSYGPGARPDRSANSHARVRGVVYETIQKHYTIPVTVRDGVLVADEQALGAWAATVGRVSRARFLQAVQVTGENTPFRAVTPPASLIGKEPTRVASAPAPSAPAPEQVAPVQVQQAPVQTSAPTRVASAPAPVAADTSQADRIAAARDAVANADSYVDMPAILDTSLEATPEGGSSAVFAPRIGSQNTSSKEETDTAVANFREMLTENGMDIENDADLAQVASLLRYTFGTPKASAVDIQDLYDFSDHYVAVGAEGLREAIQKSYEATN